MMSDEELEMQDGASVDEEQADNDTTDLSSDSGSADNSDAVAAADASHSSLASHNRVRETMAADVEAFLAHGGRIQQIDDNVMADPPRKPTSNYGSRPI